MADNRRRAERPWWWSLRRKSLDRDHVHFDTPVSLRDRGATLSSVAYDPNPANNDAIAMLHLGQP